MMRVLLVLLKPCQHDINLPCIARVHGQVLDCQTSSWITCIFLEEEEHDLRENSALFTTSKFSFRKNSVSYYTPQAQTFEITDFNKSSHDLPPSPSILQIGNQLILKRVVVPFKRNCCTIIHHFVQGLKSSQMALFARKIINKKRRLNISRITL